MAELSQNEDNSLINLDQQPIHTCGKIQPHGILLVLSEPELKIVKISNNTNNILGINTEAILGKTLDELLEPLQIEKIKVGLTEKNFEFINPTKILVKRKGDNPIIFDSAFNRTSNGELILELEPAISPENITFFSFYNQAKSSINRLEETANIANYRQIIVKDIRKITGFNRVMLYKFEEDGHGSVIAEEKLDTMEAYLNLHYPETDIPKPARKLFTSNWITSIPDTKAKCVEIISSDRAIEQQPLDLTNSILRSASPCHLEYLHNMGVRASLTISLIKDKKLWGLIACHHLTPKYVSYELRKTCEFLGRVIFAEISSKEETQDYDYRLKLSYIQANLVDYMSQEKNFINGLVKHQPNLLEISNATGAAIYFSGNWTVVGKTPQEEDLNYLVQWLRSNVEEEIFATESIASIYSDAEKFKNIATGLLAIPICQNNYVLWFRSEVIQTVNWAGDPHKAFQTVDSEGNISLSPRKSFEMWKETVRLKSLPWKQVEIKAALELRKSIVNIVLRQADELAQLAEDLSRSNEELKKFAYIASHDLQEPLNQVANYVQLLEMRYHQQLDQDAKDFIGFAVEGVSLMQTLIDDILTYSRVDLQAIELTPVEIALERALSNLRGRIAESGAIITHDSLPTVMADSTQLMQLLQNLIGNAIKFRNQNTPEIHLGAQCLEDAWLFSVRDNGIGLDPEFSDRIFTIFQRLHSRDEYPGTGIGLAICKKIVECHRGRIWVDSEPGQGATFYFTIPLGGRTRELNNGKKTENNLSN